MVEAADLIWECWNSGRTISMVPEQLIPETRREAYAIQSHYLSKTDYPSFGWKIAATSIAGQQHIGVTGPINNKLLLLTQTFVHRTHMEMFGFYFPEDIINWYIDDWINMVYKTMFYYPLKQHYCENCSGEERYDIKNKLSENDTIRYNSYTYENKVRVIVKRERKRLIKYLKGIKR